ncbi:MAG: hypothetical protein M3314_15745 [Actinomycetota bacterium]|jgi:hypothetical protein|nr:hypothetical protein [Actinomycetota bacterium]
MPDSELIQPTPITAPRRVWTDAEWDAIRRSPAAGDWEASLVGDTLTLAQRATGTSVYRARFRRELVGWKIVSAEVESHPQRYRAGPLEQESQRLALIIERFVG